MEHPDDLPPPPPPTEEQMEADWSAWIDEQRALQRAMGGSSEPSGGSSGCWL